MHGVSDPDVEHATLLKDVVSAPVGIETEPSVHADPFQASANAVEATEEDAYEPTTSQTSAETHDTPVRFAEEAPDGAAGDWIFQLVPLKVYATTTVPEDDVT